MVARLLEDTAWPRTPVSQIAVEITCGRAITRVKTFLVTVFLQSVVQQQPLKGDEQLVWTVPMLI